MKDIQPQRIEQKIFYNYTLKKYNEKIYKLVLFKFGISARDDDAEIGIITNINDEKLDNNISRTRSKIWEYATCNKFDYFITLTLNKDKHDRYDLDAFIASLGQFIRDYRKRTGKKIQYLLIPEKHQNGAYHMHGLLKGIDEKDKKLFTLEDDIPFKIKEMIRAGRKIYRWVPYEKKFGWVTMEKVRNQEAVAKYITKYIKKCVGTTVTELHKKSFYVSRGLKQAELIKKGTFPTAIRNALVPDFENDYLQIFDIDKSQYESLISQL